MATSVDVRERPILFSGAMVKALLDGRKTMTRRVIKGVFRAGLSGGQFDCIKDWDGGPSALVCAPRDWEMCPHGVPGDRLWVKETWKAHEDPQTLIDGILYRADGAFIPIEPTWEAAERWADAAHLKARPEDFKPVPGASEGLRVATLRKATGWRPSIFMPRWASRITLEIESVRVERLQSIGEEDAIAEGFAPWTHRTMGTITARHQFMELWGKINTRPGVRWEDNPWCWCITFRRLEGGAPC